MIVKKIPIFKGFLEFNYVKTLSNSVSFDCGLRPVFYDIETTGPVSYTHLDVYKRQAITRIKTMVCRYSIWVGTRINL